MSPSPPDKQPPLTQAAAWLVLLNSRSVSLNDLEQFRTWRGDPENLAAYSRLEGVWRATGELAEHSEIIAATDRAMARPRRKRDLIRGDAGVGVSIALVAVVLVCGSVWLSRITGASYVTRLGEQRLIRLQDGSNVRLDTDTRLVARLSGVQRRVQLVKGQAFFDVAHDPARPFVVQAGPALVRAIGTQFDVRREAADVRITLVEGVVQIRRGSEGPVLTLKPGEQVEAGPKLGRPSPADVRAATSWTAGQLVFRGEPLRTAVAEVNRYSTRKVLLEGGSVGDIPVTGIFNCGDVDAFAAAVSDLNGLKMRREAETLVLSDSAPAEKKS